VQTDQVPVFILCGGYGTRFKEETDHRPKPMIPIGAQPIVWHIMNKYARHGYRRFVLCLGYKGGMIRSFFGAEPQSTADQTIVYTQAGQEPWQVTLADTGLRLRGG